MPLVITPSTIILGAANIYDRALAVLTAWTSVGATMDDTTARINQSWFRPDLNGMLGPVQGLDYLTEQAAEIDFTMVEIAGNKLALAIPGATSTTTLNTDASGSPGTTTLASAGIVGDTAAFVVAITNFAVGDWLRIDVTAGGLAEYRQITTVGTAGVRGTGTGLQFRDPLQRAHASGVAAVEANGDGKTETTGSTIRRMPDTQYNQWAVVGEAPGGFYELVIDSGISTTDAAEIVFGDQTVGGIKVSVGSRYNGTTANTPPWRLRTP